MPLEAGIKISCKLNNLKVYYSKKVFFIRFLVGFRLSLRRKTSDKIVMMFKLLLICFTELFYIIRAFRRSAQSDCEECYKNLTKAIYTRNFKRN
jgi:hypothetical protein